MLPTWSRKRSRIFRLATFPDMASVECPKSSCDKMTSQTEDLQKRWSRVLYSLIRQRSRLTAGIYLCDLTRARLLRAPDALCHELSALPTRPWPARSTTSTSTTTTNSRLATTLVVVASSRPQPRTSRVFKFFAAASCFAASKPEWWWWTWEWQPAALGWACAECE